jgi:hypothetical protein
MKMNLADSETARMDKSTTVLNFYDILYSVRFAHAMHPRYP